MKIRRSSVLLAICVTLTILTLNCVGFLWAQNSILNTTTSTFSRSARSLNRHSAFIARIDSVVQLRGLATTRLHSQENVLSLVGAITHNIERGLVVLGVLLLLLLTGMGLVVHQLRVEGSAR